MRKLIAPNAMPLLIGSMPHAEPHRPLDHILRVAAESPSWPQLPNRNWREGFIAQYSESLPGVEWDDEDGTFHVNRSADRYPESMAGFYDAVFKAEESDDYSAFKISADAAMGFHEAINTFSSLKEKPQHIKIHTTGPISHGLTLLDDHDRPVFYDDDYRDVLTRNCIMKSLWQAEVVSSFCKDVICFIDEPSLASYGSTAYIGVTRDMVMETLSSVADALNQKEIISGVHVCGNTEWNMLMDTGFDIINPDIYEYGDNFLLYGDDIKAFLERGGTIAWGIVPTFLYTKEITATSLMTHLNRLMDALVDKGIIRDLLWRQCIVTPACGLGSLSEVNAEAILALLGRLSKVIQGQIGEI